MSREKTFKNRQNIIYSARGINILNKILIMANTYTQIHIQFVFAVKYRAALIAPTWKEKLQKYITGIFQSNDHKMLQINSMPDHIHILIGLRPLQSIASLIQIIKTDNNTWINKNCLTTSQFAWQEGYGAFSYSRSDLPNVIRYIQNQEKHHAKRTFREEYLTLLNKFNVPHDARYVFKPIE